MIPLFKSHYSILKSILTLEDPSKDKDKDLPDSIIDIALDNKLQQITLVEDTMASFLPANITCRQNGIKLIFGYRVSFVSDSSDKTDKSFETSHKNIIFPKNKNGYQTLIKLATLAAFDNFYKEPRLSYGDLFKYWNDDLILAVPFYDSFVHKNLLHGSLCVPDFRNIRPVFFIEENSLPFDYLIQDGILNFINGQGYPTQLSKSIYYKDRKDFEAYLTLKCLNRKVFGTGRTLDNPNFEHMSSREFSFESYLENIK